MKLERVGVFDSGQGGRIMTQYLQQQFPQLSFIFRDDQPNAPYGEKTPEQLYDLATNMITQLLAENVEAIVVACHTISSTCFAQVAAATPVPLISVNEALLEDILLLQPPPQHLGIMATTATVRANWFASQLAERLPTTQVTSVACPDLATAIDAQDDQAIDQILDECLGQLPLESIDSLALACTHYPAVKAQIEAKLSRPLRLVDAQAQVAKSIQAFILI